MVLWCDVAKSNPKKVAVEPVFSKRLNVAPGQQKKKRDLLFSPSVFLVPFGYHKILVLATANN